VGGAPRHSPVPAAPRVFRSSQRARSLLASRNADLSSLLTHALCQDPGHTNAEVGGVAGDNDPLDVVEIGSAARPTGSVVAVKPLGVFAMIDDGELDWKLIAIAVDDAKAPLVSCVADVERVFPGELQRIREWFRDYKTPDGKPQNAFGYNDECKDVGFAMGVVEETHGFYRALMEGRTKSDLSLV